MALNMTKIKLPLVYRASNDFVYNVVKSNVLSEPKPHGDEIYGL